MNYIDVKNFRKYEQLFGDNGPAKIGHVNYVIKNTNELVNTLEADVANLQTELDTKTSKIISFNRKTSSYVLQASDADKMVEMNVGSANNLTVPANVFTAGQQILISQYGAGQTTVLAGGGMTIRSSGSKNKLTAQYSGATLVFISATEAYLFGDLSA